MKKSKGEKLALRAAIPKDINRIARLSNQLGYPISEGEIAGGLGDLLGDKAHRLYVAEKAPKDIVGWIRVLSSNSLVSKIAALIGGLVVDISTRCSRAGLLFITPF